MLRSDEASGATRDRAAELNAVPGLVDIMYDFLEAHDAAHAKQKRARDDESGENDENDETAPADDDDETANATAAAAAASALEPCVADALRCLIDLTRTVATRLRVVNAGGIGPACRLMDADVFAEALAERAVVLLINCCVAGEDRDDPFSSAAKARVAVAQTGGVGKIVNGLRRSPRDPRGAAPCTSCRSSRTIPRRGPLVSRKRRRRLRSKRSRRFWRFRSRRPSRTRCRSP